MSWLFQLENAHMGLGEPRQQLRAQGNKVIVERGMVEDMWQSLSQSNCRNSGLKLEGGQGLNQKPTSRVQCGP